MFNLKCFLLLLFTFGDIDAQYGLSGQSVRMCPYPRLENGRVRMRSKSKLVKFICYPGYTLVGNKYATCRDGQWDVPMPVCVKSGCKLDNLASNILAMPSHSEAWIVFFCFPGYELIGNSAIYCNGRTWNGTVPTCVSSTSPVPLSCDFEDTHLCGWTQDELHDFDWLRLNKKTPSSFLSTGPSFDHTYGKDGSGYYMYIESTSRLENDTARLISPIYDADLTKNGCFSFFYHMFGQAVGGLRVYQKPESFSMLNLLHLEDADRQKYLLFEKWGNQGDFWYSSVSTLFDFSDSFQIVVEGVRGRSYTSDIAIDDVAILQGENCTAARNAASTPPTVIPDSCVGRCSNSTTPSTSELGCSCHPTCIFESACCPDFFEICLFSSTSSDDILPETQKLVLSTTTVAPEPPPSATTTTTTQTPSTITTPTPTPSLTTKMTTKTTIKVPNSTEKTIRTTIPTLIFKSFTPIFNGTGRLHKDTVTPKVVTIKTTPSNPTTPKKIVTTKRIETKTKKTVTPRIERKQTKKATIDLTNDMFVTPDDKPKSQSSSGFKTTILTITALLCLAGVIWLVSYSRTASGRHVLSRLRGRAMSDPEVRYLNSDVDD